MTPLQSITAGHHVHYARDKATAATKGTISNHDYSNGRVTSVRPADWDFAIAIDALKNELMVVKQAAEAAQKRSAALSNELEEAGKAAEECRELRRILDIRNEQVMQLEGQIQMMARGQLNGDDENWLGA